MVLVNAQVWKVYNVPGVGDVELLQYESKATGYQEARDLCDSQKGSVLTARQKLRKD